MTNTEWILALLDFGEMFPAIKISAKNWFTVLIGQTAMIDQFQTDLFKIVLFYFQTEKWFYDCFCFVIISYYLYIII